ncbi:MAG: AroM family protein [Clostridia bacterium]|nr:AroM family protein [Clostridia bacterium]MBQ6692827.1 AroM family protein [Clostridia bacterium]MBQ7113256.1 AroM family protein [Clostridia bacterium]
MKLLYLLPGNVEIGLGMKEMERRGAILQSIAQPGTTIDISYVPTGPASIESMCDEYQAIPGVIKAVAEAEQAGYDGVIVGCAGDPGVDGAREMVKIPVIGPAQASYVVCSMLGRKFSIITPLQEMIGTTEELVVKCGLKDKLASLRSTDITVLDINRNPNIAKERTLEEAIKARDIDKADCITLGCMSLAFAQIDKEISAEIGIPVVNPLTAAVHLLESMVLMGVSHSKKAYPLPIKLRG